MQRELSIFNESDGTLYSHVGAEYMQSDGKIGDALTKAKNAVVKKFTPEKLNDSAYKKLAKNNYTVLNSSGVSMGGFHEKGTVLLKKGTREAEPDPLFREGNKNAILNEYQKKYVEGQGLDIIGLNNYVVFGKSPVGTIYDLPIK
jgi:hypothetical protein